MSHMRQPFFYMATLQNFTLMAFLQIQECSNLLLGGSILMQAWVAELGIYTYLGGVNYDSTSLSARPFLPNQ